MVEFVEDTDKMQDIVDKMQNTTFPSRCKTEVYMILHQEIKMRNLIESYYSIFSGG